MMKSLYSGVAGLKTHNQRMDVIGNNISNVNTTAFKASAVTFKDIFYQSKSRSSSGSATSGGRNSNQVGYGAALSSISHIMTQSGLTYSDKETDCAIYGDGFFQVMDQAGNIYYTRSGVFHIDNYGNLCDPNGYIVLGVSGDPTGVDASSQRINLYVPPVDNNAASVTKTISVDGEGYTFTVTASSYGEEGNINVQFVHSSVPFATQNNSSITVMMDLNQDFGRVYQRDNNGDYQLDANGQRIPEVDDDGNPVYSSEQAALDFEDAVYEAIRLGGIQLENVLPLQFDFVSLPPEPEAKQATNTLTYTKTYQEIDPATGLPKLDEDGDEIPVSVADLNLTITANTRGAFGNSLEIDIVTNSKATDLKARWDNNVLIITVPSGEGLQKYLEKYAEDNNLNQVPQDITVGMLQAVIDAAGGADPNKKLTVAVGDNGITAEDNEDEVALNAATIASIAGNKDTLRLGLGNGKDSFFKTLAESLGSMTLTGGRVEAVQTTQDLQELFIDDDGVVYGVHSVHGTIALGRIDIVTFENPEGLNQAGTSYWTESLSSGQPQVRTANSYGVGSVVSGAQEMSNVDLAQEISDMIITQRGYQANTRVITVTDTMLEELVNLKR